MNTLKALLLGTALVASLTIADFPAAQARGPAQVAAPGPYQHVLLLSIDGLHASDLANWIASKSGSTGALAHLSLTGTTFANAFATAPSNGFPGMLGIATGGTPLSTGVYWDDSYDRNLYAPGSNCATSPNPGTEVNYTQAIDTSTTTLFPTIDPTTLPLQLSGSNCTPVYPHQFTRTNTVFEAIHSGLSGSRTAWADDHPSYDILNGPSGTGVDDLFTPELNSTDPQQTSIDYTGAYTAAQLYDSYKVQAVLNQIAGKDSSGKHTVGVPQLFGMNFKSVEIGQRLPKSGPGDTGTYAGLVGGYKASNGTFDTALIKQLQSVDTQIGTIVSALQTAGLANSTLVIVTAKYGEAPINRTGLTHLDPRSRLLHIYNTYYPPQNQQGAFFAVYSDIALIWLNPVNANTSNMTDYVHWRYYTEHHNALYLHLESELDEQSMVQDYNANPFKDNRVPSLMILPWEGVIYSTTPATTTELADHGGFTNDDLNVALLVSAPNMTQGYNFDAVGTTQVAPTILTALGLNASPSPLQSVQIEGTQALPITLP